MSFTDSLDVKRSGLFCLDGLLKKLVHRGSLSIADHRGRIHRYGERHSGDRVAIRLNDFSLPLKLLTNPSLALGEAYMDGRLTIEQGDIRDFLRIVTSNIAALDEHWLGKVRARLARLPGLRGRNAKCRARANVAHHYNLAGELYRMFLDADR